MLKGKHILLGITGSIAAYKAAIVVRMLIKEGAEVKVVMTPLAKEFITPLTIATLSKNPILVDFFNPENGQWNSHVDLGIWSDLYLIAPASANTIAKMASGVADNLLLTTYLSAKCPVVVAPAMDLDMLKHPATLKNLEVLKARGNMVVEPASGELASGLEGKGRMEEPEKIISFLKEYFARDQKLENKKILVTAGPTVESIDPVRYISNHSSGKMGYAIANAFANRGAEVILVSGPVNISVENPGIKVVKITSAKEMHSACLSEFENCDAAVMCAAVADYTPAETSKSKIKRTQKKLSIELEPNPDIAADLGKRKKDNQLLAGFALETENGIENAKQKLIKKNLDFIVLNSLSDQSIFNSDYNKVTIIDKDNNIQHFELKDKQSVASDIADKVVEWFNKKSVK